MFYNILLFKKNLMNLSLVISSFVFYLVCDMVLIDYSGVIESLNFLNFYFYNWNCIWVI